jgi:transcriptional regulator with XRE-family HTH domain
MINDIHHKLRAVRREKNFSQEYMALHTDISQKAYSKYETGETKMSEDYLIKFANAMGVSKEYIETKEVHQPNININNCTGDLIGNNNVENYNKTDNELLQSVLILMEQMNKNIATNNDLLLKVLNQK